ncbi:MAG: hypothetical protein KIS61_25380, partial [Candidatus Eremiobacteraeota bacterium]|nr:hypothetical protein [Candidatus Eremiobacteraeota bacterium]
SYFEVNQVTIAAELLKATQGIGAPLSLHFPCPCGSKVPLSSCHGAKIGKLREALSREELSILWMALATKVEGGRRLNRLSLLNSSVLIASREVDFARLYYMQRNRPGWKQRPAK